jgi:hypothetical protein
MEVLEMLRSLGISAMAALVLAFLGCTSAPVPQASAEHSVPHSLVGTWRLVEVWDLDKEGNKTYPYGVPPRGYIVYDSTGHVFVGFMRNPPVSPDGFGQEQPPSQELKSQAWDAYAGYFGTYSVDWAAGVVTHHVEGAWNPSYLRRDQPRPFTLKGDTLVLGDQKTWQRVLVRVPGQSAP